MIVLEFSSSLMQGLCESLWHWWVGVGSVSRDSEFHLFSWAHPVGSSPPQSTRWAHLLVTWLHTSHHSQVYRFKERGWWGRLMAIMCSGCIFDQKHRDCVSWHQWLLMCMQEPPKPNVWGLNPPCHHSPRKKMQVGPIWERVWIKMNSF